MSVQFLEARACQRHDLGEPVFGDGVLSMIVVPRQFTPCDACSRTGFVQTCSRTSAIAARALNNLSSSKVYKTLVFEKTIKINHV